MIPSALKRETHFLICQAINFNLDGLTFAALGHHVDLVGCFVRPLDLVGLQGLVAALQGGGHGANCVSAVTSGSTSFLSVSPADSMGIIYRRSAR